MGSSMAKAAKVAGLYLWSRICWWTSSWVTSLLQDVQQPRVHRPILECETVFREVLDTEGNVVYGTHSSECDDMYLSQSDKEVASRVTLLREHVTS